LTTGTPFTFSFDVFSSPLSSGSFPTVPPPVVARTFGPSSSSWSAAAGSLILAAADAAADAEDAAARVDRIDVMAANG